jgi:hypothetical protein
MSNRLNVYVWGFYMCLQAEEKAMVWIDVHKESLPCKPASLKQFALGSGRFQQNTGGLALFTSVLY